MSTLLIFLVSPALASGSGITGYSGAVDTCATCHTDTDAFGATTEVTGPTTAAPGEVLDLTLLTTYATGTPDRASFDISADVGTLLNVAAESRLDGTEIVHNSSPALLFANSAAELAFQWQAPDAEQTATVYACANVTDGLGTNGDDPACTTLEIVVEDATTGGTTTPPTDTGETGGTTVPDDTGPATDPQGTDTADTGLTEEDKSCGCATGGSSGGGALLLVCAGLVRRRNRMLPRHGAA